MRFAVALLGLAACVGPTVVMQRYAGPPRPREAIAMLRVNGGDTVRLLAIDGERADTVLANDMRLHIELLPGRHEVSFANAAVARPRALRMAFDAEAGKVYRILFSPAAPETGTLQEVDRDSDAVLRDVTPATPAPPDEERRETLPPP